MQNEDTPHAHPSLQEAKQQVERITDWAKERSLSFEKLLSILWLEPEQQLENDEPLSTLLRKGIPSVSQSFFSNQELILQILEIFPTSWHEDYLNVYQQTLFELIKNNKIHANSLIKFLATTKVGVNRALLDQLQHLDLDDATALNLRMLNVIRAIAIDDQELLKYWEKKSETAILDFQEGLNEKKNNNNERLFTTALYHLPVLGLLWHEEHPKKFIYRCIDLSFKLTGDLNEEHPQLIKHLRLYFRSAILCLCRAKKWDDLITIQREISGWSEDLFEAILQQSNMEKYSRQISNAKISMQDKELEKSPSTFEKELDKIVAS